MRKRIKRIIDDVIYRSGKIFSVDTISYDIDGDRIHIECDISAEAPLPDMEIDDIDYYVNVSFEGNYFMSIQGIVFNSKCRDSNMAESCKSIYKMLKEDIIDRISERYEDGDISPDEYDILFNLCEDIKRNLWSVRELI